MVVYPWPAQIAHDTVDSREVRIWRDWCQGKCKRFITLFPAFFAIKDQCPRTQPGCWYLSHFIFGDTHYNSAGDAVVADVMGKALTESPCSEAPVGNRKPRSRTDHPARVQGYRRAASATEFGEQPTCCYRSVLLYVVALVL